MSEPHTSDIYGDFGCNYILWSHTCDRACDFLWGHTLNKHVISWWLKNYITQTLGVRYNFIEAYKFNCTCSIRFLDWGNTSKLWIPKAYVYILWISSVSIVDQCITATTIMISFCLIYTGCLAIGMSVSEPHTSDIYGDIVCNHIL